MPIILGTPPSTVISVRSESVALLVHETRGAALAGTLGEEAALAYPAARRCRREPAGERGITETLRRSP
jgi:hypothetical protein